MTFVTPWLLFGCLFAAVPIILHLLLRQQPQKLEFPALRFLKARRESNRKSLNVRHWILLACRILLIVLLAALLARPSIQRSVGSSRSGPVAAALVFDTSIRMKYRYENQTILDKARQEGLWILGQFPSGSELAVLDSQNSANAFSVDRSAAKYRIEKLKAGPKVQDLGASIAAAAKLLGQSTLGGRELYVFTDLAASGWDRQTAASVVNSVKSQKNIAVYVIDVGAKQIINDSIEQLSLKRELLIPGEDLVLDVEIKRSVPVGISASERKVELFIQNLSGDPQKRGERLLGTGGNAAVVSNSVSGNAAVDTSKGAAPVKQSAQTDSPTNLSFYPSNSSSSSSSTGSPTKLSTAGETTESFRFSATGFEPGVYQGWIELSGADGLAEDDIRYFSFEASSPRRVLLVVSTVDQKSESFLRQALSPSLLRESNKSRFSCELASQSDLDSNVWSLPQLADFDAILLLDPNPISSDGWKKLLTWTASGKGLGIFLGAHAAPLDSFNSPDAQKLLPGKLQLQARAPEGSNWIWPRSFVHPILEPFANHRTNVPWNAFPVYRYWQLSDFASGVNTVLRLNDLRPLFLERPVGRGTVLTFTTPIGESPSVAGSAKSWNALASSESWPIFILVNQMAEYLAQTQRDRLNYLASETTAIIVPDNAPDRYKLIPNKGTDPDAMELRSSVQENRALLVVPAPERSGNFWLGTETALENRESTVDSASSGASEAQRLNPIWSLSYNYSDAETNLRRLSSEELDQFWSGYPYSLNKNRTQIEQNLAGGRIGWELFSVLATLLLLAVVAETILSCRFYSTGFRKNQ